MPQVIEVPGVGKVEFPDGMTDAAIVGAIQKMQPAKPINAAQGVGSMEAGLVAAGKSTDSILDGITQLYLKAKGEDKALGGLAQNVAEKEGTYAPLKEAHPTATSLGEAVPAMIPGGGVGKFAQVLRSGAAGAIPGALSYGSAEERLSRGVTNAAGNMIGTSAGLGLGKLLKPAGRAPGVSADALAAADRLGMKMSPGQWTQNPAMQGFENYLARSPGSSGAMQAKKVAQAAALDTAAARSMGQTATDLSEGTFSTAKKAIGGEFERLQAITKPQLGDDFLQAVGAVDSANGARGAFRNAAIDKLVDRSLDLAVQGKLSGTAYKEIRSELSAEATKAFKGGDATVGQAYKAIRKALDDAAEQSLSAADKEAWKLTREQWKAYKTLSGGNVSEAGTVSAPRLAAALRREGDGLRTGAAKGPLADIARVGEAMKGVANPTSGQLTQNMMYGNPVTGIPMVLGNKASGAIYNSAPMQAYLSRGLLDIGEGGQSLLNAGARPFGQIGMQNYLGVR